MLDPGRALGLSLINLYQQKIRPSSIERCPFYISCSHFARQSITKYGFVRGIIPFIDRYYFREHPYSFNFYPLAANAAGQLKLDDSPYIGESSPGSRPLASMRLTRHSPVAKDQIGFADMLYNEGDFDRAITVYKQILFFSEEVSTRKKCQFQISRCYLALNDYLNAMIWLSQYVQQNKLTDAERNRAIRLKGMNYALHDFYGLAITEIEKSLPGDGQDSVSNIYLGWINAETENWKASAGYFREAKTRMTDDSKRLLLENWTDVFENVDSQPWKSPKLAGLMSAVVPGSGQCYSNHYFDGMQAFTYVAVFGIATWAAYRYESSFHQPRIGTITASMITATFHISNIWGAQQTTKFRNRQIKNRMLEPVRKEVLEMEFREGAP